MVKDIEHVITHNDARPSEDEVDLQSTDTLLAQKQELPQQKEERSTLIKHMSINLFWILAWYIVRSIYKQHRDMTYFSSLRLFFLYITNGCFQKNTTTFNTHFLLPVST